MLSISIGEKNDLRKLLDPFQGFTLKMVLGIHDPRISWILSGTKNHEMRDSLYSVFLIILIFNFYIS